MRLHLDSRRPEGALCWKIENETFNTLKHQGYHLEHNFGHGEQNLSVVSLALLMMLAFLVDQTQQLCCPLFRAVWQKIRQQAGAVGQPRVLYFRHFAFMSMQHLYAVMLNDLAGKSRRLPSRIPLDQTSSPTLRSPPQRLPNRSPLRPHRALRHRCAKRSIPQGVVTSS